MPPSSRTTIDGLSIAPIVEGALLAIVQGSLVALLGVGLFLPALTALLPTVVLTVRWSDPLMLHTSDALAAVGVAALLLSPIWVTHGPEFWLLQLAFTIAGIVLARVQLLPTQPPEDALGVEAHLRQVRKEGIERPTGNADRAPATGGLDPIGGLFGGGGSAAPRPLEDPYENTKAIQYDPEDR